MTHAEIHQNLRQRLNPRRIEHAQRKAAGPGGIRQRPQDVKHRPDLQFPARPRHVLHRAVQGPGEQEPDAHFVDTPADALGRGLDVHAQGFQHVRAAALAGCASIAVFGHGNPGARHHKRRRGADVERAGMVAACADHVHERPARGRHPRGHLPHRCGQARDLVDGLAFHVQRDEEPADLGVGGGARHQFPHGFSGLFLRKILPLDEGCDGFLDHDRPASTSPEPKGAVNKGLKPGL